jgi:CubicO group peptidase (beta-lactamase class C family)
VTYLRIVIATLVALFLLMGVAIAGALYGWWCQSPAPTGDAQMFMGAAINKISKNNRGNAALVLIENGTIFDEYYTTTSNPVDRNTVFPTASMSKWITAWGIMKLVEDGKLDLDRPIEEYLTRWCLPVSAFDNRGVTTRRLLSHTAGLTDGLGFGDYRPDEPLPTLEQTLANPRTSSGEPTTIKVGVEPGREWRYSGGGYLVLELLIEEVSGEAFEAFIERRVLQPLAMTHSGYPTVGKVENFARSCDAEGRPAAVYQYASKGATGFAASAGDMAKFAIAQLAPDTNTPLAAGTINAIRRPHASQLGIEIWGLGVMLYAPAARGDFVFGHDGANEPAINASVRVNPVTGDGIVVLVTGSRTLASDVGSDWVFWQTGLPDFLSIPGEIKRVVPVVLGGGFAILLVATVMGWRLRRARQRKDASPEAA